MAATEKPVFRHSNSYGLTYLIGWPSWLLFPLFMIFFGLEGCNGKGIIKGLVVTNDDLVESGMAPGIDRDKRNTPVRGATIFLSLDEQGKQRILSTITSSDKSGRYMIATRNIPSSKDPNGYYYLVVEHAGYNTFRYRILVGNFANFNENTVFLKKTKAGGEE